jgi:hypothetical protein
LKPYFIVLVGYFILVVFPGLLFAPVGGAAIPTAPNLARLGYAFIWICIPYAVLSGIVLLLLLFVRKNLSTYVSNRSRHLVRWFSLVSIVVFSVGALIILIYLYPNPPELYNPPTSPCGCAQLLPSWIAGSGFGWLVLNLGYLWLTRGVPEASSPVSQ